MTKRKVLVALLLFALFELLVWGLSFAFVPENLVLVGGILTACGLTVLLVYILVSRLISKGAAPEPATSRQNSAAVKPLNNAAFARDYEDLDALIAEANNHLAKSPALAKERVRTRVNELPLYLLLGPEGSGKTATFVSAGMNAELLAGHAIPGAPVAPTRLSNLWFAAGGLIVELSGRILSNEDAGWQRLLERLRADNFKSPLHRLFASQERDQNLKGIFLFCGIESLLGVPDADRQSSLVAWFRDRLRKIGELYGLEYPVYVIFTHADAVPYFNEYFSRLREGEDQQILGATVTPESGTDRAPSKDYTEAENRRLLGAFNDLYQSLAEKRMTFLERETDRAQKPPVYEFPRELKRIRSTIVQFLVDVFRPNPLQPGPMLRGFYFTGTRKVAVGVGSGAQRNDSTQRVGEATRIFRQEDLQALAGLTPAPQSTVREQVVSRFTFIAQLFRQAITQDRGLVAPAGAGRKLRLARRAFYISLASLFALLTIFFTVSWSRNRTLINETQRAVLNCKPFRGDARGLASLPDLQRIEALRERLQTLITYHDDGPPTLMRFGLYSGNRILEGTRQLYFERFREYFLDRVVRETDTQLAALRPSENPQFPYDAVYQNLKSYRTMTVSPESGCKVDPAFSPWLGNAYRGDRAIDSESQQIITRNLNFYVSELGRHELPFTINERKDPTIAGRQYLDQFGGEQRIYRAIIEQVNQSVKRPVRVTDYSPKYALVMTGPQEVAAAFSILGRNAVLDRIKNVKSAALGDSCVLGSYAAQAKALVQSAELEGRLRDLYVRDYIRIWREFLNGQKVITYRGAADAAKKLEVLQDNDSPILGMLFMTHESTSFPPDGSSPAAKTALAAAPNLIDRFGYRLGRLGRAARVAREVSKDVKLPPQQLPKLNTADITVAFQPVHELFTADAQKTRWTGDKNRTYLAALTQMQRSMDALAQSSARDTDQALNGQANQAMLGGLDRVKTVSESFIRGPENVYADVTKVLSEPFQSTKGHYITDFGKAEAKKLNGGLAPLCAKLQPLLAKYPFNAQSTVDARLEEVSAVFSPQSGALWAFYQSELAASLVKQGHRYLVRPDKQDVKIAPEFLEQFNRLALITEALYPEGEAQPRMKYRLAPLPNPAVKSIALTIDGEKMTTAPKQFFWPGNGSPELRLLVKIGDLDVPFASYPGVWGVFAMMADADVRASGSRVIGLTYLSHGRGRSEPVRGADGSPITVRLEIQEFPGGIETSFDKNFFTHLRCPSRVATP